MSCTFLQSQVTLNPVFATQYDSVTVEFDASKGSKGLMNLSPAEVYMHTGVITNKSTSLTDWRNVQGVWGTDDVPRKMDYKGGNIYTKKIHIHTFYGLTSSDTVKRLAFVFRNRAGNKEGKTADGQDIFVDLSQAGLQVKFQNPITNPSIFKTKDTVSVKIIASQESDITLYVKDSVIKTAAGVELWHTFEALNPGNYEFIAKAEKSGITHKDTLRLVVRPDNPEILSLPSKMEEGVNYLNDSSVLLCIYAPQKEFIYVQGDFNHWNLDNSYFMHRTPDGNRWWIQIDNLQKEKPYAYIYNIEGTLKVADPLAELVLDPWNDGWIKQSYFPNLPAYPHGKTTGIVSVFTPGKNTFEWKHSDFTIKNPEALNIYELHIRDFIGARDYPTLSDTIKYLKSLGINAIKLMPIGEFEGNNSWGYNPSFHMAVDKYYGNETQLKEFIDRCHGEQIAVFLDIVLNHAFGQSSHCRMYWDAANNQPASNNPWLNPTAKHDFNVGYDYNHESSATKYFTDRVLKHWLTEFKFDGFRFDLSKGFTQKNTLGNTAAWGNYDPSRIALWKRIRDQIRIYDTTAILILEHFADNDEEKELSDLGFYLWGNANHDYNEATMGYASNLSWGSSYKARNWNRARLISYMESHDEERLMYKNLQFGTIRGNYNTKDLRTALKRMEMATCLFFTIPGPKMIWQFGELGYDVNINFNGRTGEKPIRWEYLQNEDRARLKWIYSTLMNLRNTYPVFHTTDFNHELNAWVKKTWLQQENHKIHALANTGVDVINTTVNLQDTGIWYELFSGDSFNANSSSFGITMQAGEYRLYTNKKMNITPFNFQNEQNNSLELENMHIRIYPNPAKNQIYIQGLNPTENTQVTIYDLNGRLRYQERFLSQTIDIGSLHSGIYLIEILGQQYKISHRFIVSE